MDIVLLLVVAASGLYAVSSHGGRHYYFVFEQKNMTEAQSYCREKYTDLATIDNMEDVNILNKMADSEKMSKSVSLHEKSAWIGLYDDVNSWRWSHSDRSFYKDGGKEFRPWWPGDPDNFNSGEHCTLMYYDGRWYDYSCAERYKAVCFDVRGPNVTFVLTINAMNWTEAQSYCREHHTDLASIRNMAENQKVNALANQEIWIGLFRNSWKWLDGSNSSFTYWKTGEPNNLQRNEACVTADFDNSGKWEDRKCDHERVFICYGPPPKTKQVIRLRLKKNTPLDLNDPAVMEEMLKQLKQKLKDQGVNEDVKLSWKKQPDGKIFHKEKKESKKKRDAVKKKEEL